MQKSIISVILATTALIGNTNAINPLEGLESTEPLLLSDEFVYTEGVVYLPKEDIALFADIPTDTIYEYVPTTNSFVKFRENSMTWTNGLALDKDDNLIMCDSNGIRMGNFKTRSEPIYEIITTNYYGKTFNSPNDVVSDSKGNIFFTDPAFAETPGSVGTRGVYHINPEGEITLVKGFDEPSQPNGINISPQDDFLYVVDVPTSNVWRFPIIENEKGIEIDGDNGEIFFNTGNGGDGLDVDSDNNIYIACQDGTIKIFDGETGEQYPDEITFPDGVVASNVAFGGKDLKTLYITAGNSFYTMKVGVAGNIPSQHN